MSTEILYFSGTGNSLIVARELSKKLNAKLTSIAQLLDEKEIISEAKINGFVFPVYFAEYSGIPLIVKRFIEKFQGLESKYIFAVCTHHGLSGLTIDNFNELIHKLGGQLSAGFTLSLFVPFSLSIKLKKLIFKKDIDIFNANLKKFDKIPEILKKSQEKIDYIANYVLNKQTGKFESQGKIRKFLLVPHRYLMRYGYKSRYSNLAKQKDLTFLELIKHSDKSFEINDSCTGCGICAHICPVDNIKMVDNKPEWQHNCENCIACFTWCPHDSIQGELVSYEIKFHHEQVRVKDIIKANS